MALGICFVGLLGLVTPTAALAQDTTPHLLFSNRSHATVHIEIAPATLAEKIDPVIVLPLHNENIYLPSGKHLAVLKLPKTMPPRVHRFIADVPQSGSHRYEFSAFRLGRYLLRDVGPKVIPPSLPSKQTDNHQLNDRHGVNALVSFEQVCKSKQIVTFRAVLWEDKANPIYFNKRSGHLCSEDGTELFLSGDGYSHFFCANNWKDCKRNTHGDFQILPTIYSSELPDDTALQLARRDEPRMPDIESQKTVSLSNPKRIANIAEYFLYNSDRSKP